jgi:hypothetical protein
VNTPELQIADDDYSVGLLVDKIAHSRYANDTLIFIIEDDPQDGADHVSGDRSLAFILGPYVKQGGAVVSDHYSTVSMLRTIEDVLGVSHLSVHDAGVPPMSEAFDTSQHCHPLEGGGSSCWTYSATPSLYLYNTTLPLPPQPAGATVPRPTHDAAWWDAKTKGMNFNKEDMNDPAVFNRIIWEGLKGSPYPTTRSGADLRRSGTPQPETRQVDTGSRAK